MKKILFLLLFHIIKSERSYFLRQDQIFYSEENISKLNQGEVSITKS